MVPDDAEAVSALRRATFSYSVMSPASTRHLIEVHSPAEKFLGLVAISGRDLVAWGATGLNTWTSEEGQAGISIYVHPEHRRQGIADALAKPLHDHLAEIGAVRARAFAEPGGVEFAKRFGYDGTRQMHYSGVDPRVSTPSWSSAVSGTAADARGDRTGHDGHPRCAAGLHRGRGGDVG